MNDLEKRMGRCCHCALMVSLCSLAANEQLHGQCQLNEDLKVMPSDTINALSGQSVAVHGETAIVGSPGAEGEGSATVYVYNGTNWVVDSTLSPSDLGTGDGFGHAVAIHEDLIAVSANGDDGDNNQGPTNGGAVYIFRKSSSWTLEDTIRPSSIHASSEIGWALDFSDDGKRVIIGAPLFDTSATTDIWEGVAYIYRHQLDSNGDDEWVQEAMLTAGNYAHADARFGASVAMTDYTAVVGAFQQLQSSGIPGQELIENVGQAFVFRRSGTTWSDDQEIFPPHEEIENANFGRSVALQSDDQGDTLIIGATHDHARFIIPTGEEEEEEVVIEGTGAVYVYYEKYVSGSYKFKLGKQIHAPVPMDDDRFGISVSLDGDTLLVGAPGDDDACGVGVPGGCDFTGIAYLFERDLGGVGNWGILSTLNASDPARFDWFGLSVGVSGNRAVVGAWEEDQACNGGCPVVKCPNMEANEFCNSGAAYFFWTITDPDSCDCNGNTIPDWIDVEQETSIDCDGNGAPDECDCRADVYGCDKEVNVDDVFELIGAFGDCPTDGPCREDIGPGLFGDGKVDQHDLNVLLRNWGICGLPAGSVQVDQLVQDCIDDCSMSDPDCLYDCLNGN